MSVGLWLILNRSPHAASLPWWWRVILQNGTQRWTEEQLQRAIENEMKTEKSAKEISVELAKLSGWNKKEIYTLINQKKE